MSATTDTSRAGVKRQIGGDKAHRGLFGGTMSRSRMIAFGLAGAALLFLTPSLGIWGLAIALVLGVGGFLITQRTHRGSMLERWERRRRWRIRRTDGTDAFVPYDAAVWAQLTEAIQTSRGAARRTAARERRAMRAFPDGADGMSWLQLGRRQPGVAWHAPLGEQAYLSVVFSVSGQIAGVEPASSLRRAAEAWGTFLEGRAAYSNLVDQVQTVTRVLPADSTLQQEWVLSSLDRSAPMEAIESYEQVLDRTGRGTVQRHYIIVRWPLTPAFVDAAARYGEGRDGWRALMVEEIETTRNALANARLGEVDVLTARRAAAVILHMQNPARPIDFVSDVDPRILGVPSHDELSAHVVEGVDPIRGGAVQWWHRTAAIRSENLETGPRSQLWLLPLLLGTELRGLRTVSFQLRLIPKNEAREAARNDVVKDSADVLDDRQKGRLASDYTTGNLTGARLRNADLSSGSPHHGAEWVGYVTITERDRAALQRASRALEETCKSGLGVQQLEWLDSYQAAASGSTWPIARGLSASTRRFSATVFDRLAGKSDKEAIA